MMKTSQNTCRLLREPLQRFNSVVGSIPTTQQNNKMKSFSWLLIGLLVGGLYVQQYYSHKLIAEATHSNEDPMPKDIRVELSVDGEVKYYKAQPDSVIHVIADSTDKLIDIQVIPDANYVQQPKIKITNGEQANKTVEKTLPQSRDP